MKQFIMAALVLSFSSSVFASENYVCTVKDRGSKETQSLTIEFLDKDNVGVTDEVEDNTYALVFTNENSKFKYYRDDGWDGYGGYIELRVPKSFNFTQDEEFNMAFRKETYSEIGHVHSQRLTGSCQRADN